MSRIIPSQHSPRSHRQRMGSLKGGNGFKEIKSKQRSYCKRFNCKQNSINTFRPRQNGRHFADAIFKCIFLNENVWIPIKILLKFVPQGPINNISALVQIMAWRRPGDKPLSEPIMVSLPTHICVTRPQWVNYKQYMIDVQSGAIITWSI